jgi:hypothetical protein
MTTFTLQHNAHVTMYWRDAFKFAIINPEIAAHLERCKANDAMRSHRAADKRDHLSRFNLKPKG